MYLGLVRVGVVVVELRITTWCLGPFTLSNETYIHVETGTETRMHIAYSVRWQECACKCKFMKKGVQKQKKTYLDSCSVKYDNTL